jgi:hypothetical protein
MPKLLFCCFSGTTVTDSHDVNTNNISSAASAEQGRSYRLNRMNHRDDNGYYMGRVPARIILNPQRQMANYSVNGYHVSRTNPRVFHQNIHAYQHNSIGVFNPDENDQSDYSSDSDPYEQSTYTRPVVNIQDHPRVLGPNGFRSFADGSANYRNTQIAQPIPSDYNDQVHVNHVHTIHRSQQHFQVRR